MAIPKGKTLALVAAFLAIGLVAGTGAFTTVSAQRTASVSVSGDSSALLGLNPVDGNNYASISDGTLEISLDKVNLNAETKVGVIFVISNNGDEEVAIDVSNSDYTDNSGPETESSTQEDGVDFVVNDTELAGSTSGLSATTQIGYGGASDENVYSLNDNTLDIPAGEAVGVGIYIDTTSVSGLTPGSPDAGDLIDEIDITADADNVDGNDVSDDGNMDAATGAGA